MDQASTNNENTAVEASERLRLYKEEILTRWEFIVRRELEEARRESKLTLRDSLPRFLDTLADALRERQIAGQVRSSLLKVAREHADDRAYHSDYTIEQVIREYELLRKIIFDVLEKEQLLIPSTRETILEAVTTGMAKATGEFAELAAKREEEIQEQLEESEVLFKTVFELAAAGKAIVDVRTGRFLNANRKLADLLGYTVAELKRMTFLEVTHPADRERSMAELEKNLASRSQGWSLEKRYVRKDGEVVWTIASGALIRDRDGKPAQIIVTVVDISEQKQITDRLLEEKALREQFVNTLTHDLRTPLSAIKMAAQILQRKREPETMREMTDLIVSNVIRGDQMIQDLLDANRIKAGQLLIPNIQPIGMLDVVRDTVRNLEAIYGNRFEIRASGSFHGYWCPAGIRRIVENFASNAIKYGSKETPVTISLEDLSSLVRISVHNFGNPMPKEEMATLFEHFKRTKTAEASGAIGWGIGLTVVTGITEAHCGEISVESSAEAGTTFSVTLPRDARPCLDERLRDKGEGVPQ